MIEPWRRADDLFPFGGEPLFRTAAGFGVNELHHGTVLGGLVGARHEILDARHPVPADGFTGVQDRDVLPDLGERRDEAGEGNAVLDERPVAIDGADLESELLVRVEGCKAFRRQGPDAVDCCGINRLGANIEWVFHGIAGAREGRDGS